MHGGIYSASTSVASIISRFDRRHQRRLTFVQPFPELVAADFGGVISTVLRFWLIGDVVGGVQCGATFACHRHRFPPWVNRVGQRAGFGARRDLIRVDVRRQQHFPL